ncbi:mitochondrial succinate-fumarate transporter 1-like [Canna indica]|uniref:Mitochondrial succinate-fumarate transporter 1-like n=1 Tax=Canna indica TaxID=4628 RepID=A0AAQ3JZ16_9LILI|nr:mitochondrial succinate-fumarate transporter 1-like [Canna indica]
MAATTAPASESSRRSNVSSTLPYMRAVAGSLGGVMEACCLQPIDVIKMRVQRHDGSANGGGGALYKSLTPFVTHLTLKYALRMCSNAALQSALNDASTGELEISPTEGGSPPLPPPTEPSSATSGR